MDGTLLWKRRGAQLVRLATCRTKAINLSIQTINLRVTVPILFDKMKNRVSIMNPRKSTGSSEFDEFVEDKYEGYTFIQKRYGLRLTC